MRVHGHGHRRLRPDLERTREALANGDFRRLRESLGMGLPMLARSADVDLTALSRYERGLASPRSVTTLWRLAQAMRGLERMARAREAAMS